MPTLLDFIVIPEIAARVGRISAA